MNEPCNGTCSECPLTHGHYTVPGRPIPLNRPRFVNNHVWDKQKQLKINAGIYLDSQHDQEQFSGPVALYATFYFAPAPSYSKKKKEALYSQPHIYKPDLSNLTKFIEDIAIGILYHDDCIIAQLFCEKVYAEEGLTKLSIYELESR